MLYIFRIICYNINCTMAYGGPVSTICIFELGGKLHQMACKVTTVPFRGTKEQEQQLLAVIDELRDTPGALMPIMQRAQDIYGYLPIEVQTIIADQMNVPLEKIYGIATFYAQFALAPKGQYRISVCLGTACYVKGAQAVRKVKIK